MCRNFSVALNAGVPVSESSGTSWTVDGPGQWQVDVAAAAFREDTALQKENMSANRSTEPNSTEMGLVFLTERPSQPLS